MGKIPQREYHPHDEPLLDDQPAEGPPESTMTPADYFVGVLRDRPDQLPSVNPAPGAGMTFTLLRERAVEERAAREREIRERGQ